MKRTPLFVILLISFIVPSIAYSETNKVATVPSYRSGDIQVIVPAPTEDFVDTGYDNREFWGTFTPPENRLLGVYMLKNELDRQTINNKNSPMSRYGMFQVSRQAENQTFKKKDFENIVTIIKQQLGDELMSVSEYSEDLLKKRFKALDLDSVKAGTPLMLGQFFNKKQAYGFGMMINHKTDDLDFVIVTGSALIHVKDKMFLAYLYSTYENTESIMWVQRTTEQWTDAIIEANSPDADKVQ